MKRLLRREKKYMYENIGEMYLRQKKIDAFIEEADMAIQSEKKKKVFNMNICFRKITGILTF